MGLWKDEAAGRIIIYCCALASKVYAIEIENSDEIENSKIMRLKGVMKRITKAFEPQDFKNVLDNQLTLRARMARIATIKQVNYTIVYNRISLNHVNSKRVIVNGDFVNTFALGHYATMEHVD